jgi:hypothetical protein
VNPVRQALYSRLAGDVTLVAMLSTPTAIYHQIAPREAGEPLIVFNKQAGRDVYAFGARAFVNQLWLVKATDRSLSATRAEDIAARIDVVLMDAPLTLPAGSVAYCRRETEIDYPEPDGADLFHHVGGIYRITTTP